MARADKVSAKPGVVDYKKIQKIVSDVANKMGVDMVPSVLNDRIGIRY